MVKEAQNMSVIVAIKEGDVVYFGADSQITRGSTRTTLKNPNNYKIWKTNNVSNCLMGQVGCLRDANVIRVADNLISHYDEVHDLIDYELLIKKVAPGIKKILVENSFIADSSPISMESRYLIAYKNRLYTIGYEFAVLEVDDCIAIGSGEDQALGSLLCTEGQDPRIRIVKAIKASAASDIYVDYPIIMINTKDMEFTIVTEKNESEYIEKCLLK